MNDLCIKIFIIKLKLDFIKMSSLNNFILKFTIHCDFLNPHQSATFDRQALDRNSSIYEN